MNNKFIGGFAYSCGVEKLLRVDESFPRLRDRCGEIQLGVGFVDRMEQEIRAATRKGTRALKVVNAAN